MALLKRSPVPDPAPTATPSQSVLTRSEVALVPALVISFGAFALAVSQALRPAGQMVSAHADSMFVPFAILSGVVAGALALVIHRTTLMQREGAVWIYVAGAAALMFALSLGALLDSGLATVALGSVMLVSFYIGFVFPYRIARASLLVLLLVLGGLQAAVPEADGIEALSTLALAISGWLLGRIPRMGHRIASRHALVLSRSDVLTKVLNRRGFIEEFAHELRVGAAEGSPIALIVIDLNGFKLINDRQGHAAGDEMLAWVASRVASLLPARAIFGRMGGDEFAAALPGISEISAEALAKSLHAALAERIGASIGVAAQPTGAAGVDELFRVADVGLYAAKADPTRRVQVREVPASTEPIEPDAAAPPYTYARLRAGKGPRERSDTDLRFDGQWVLAGYVAIALSGLVFVASTWAWGGDTFFEELIRYGGAPWVLLNLGLGVGYRNRPIDTGRPLTLPIWASSVLVGVGVGTACLSTGDGAASPILAGLYLKLIFDAATFERRDAAKLSSVIVGFWLLVLVLGPADALWVVPFQLVMLVGAFRLGLIGRHAFESATRARMQLALTDPLTGLLNRRGFMRRADRIVSEAQAGPLAPVVIALDLDDFKTINDTRGHAVGDALLRDVATACAAVLGDEFALGRVGGDEFVAIAPAMSNEDLGDLIEALDERLETVVAASVGSGVYGPDGVELDQLLQVADHRAYAIKQERASQQPGDASVAAPTGPGYEGPERRRPRGDRRLRDRDF